jgi:hypothetical protein
MEETWNLSRTGPSTRVLFNALLLLNMVIGIQVQFDYL